MTMRDEYRKANDAIHAPQSLLSALHEAADEDTPVLFEPEKPRVWPKVAAFSGIAAAAAVLALIVFLPRNNRSTAPQAAAKAADAEIVYATETTMESAMSDEAPAEAPMLSASLYAAGSAASADGGEDERGAAGIGTGGEPFDQRSADASPLSVHDKDVFRHKSVRGFWPPLSFPQIFSIHYTAFSAENQGKTCAEGVFLFRKKHRKFFLFVFFDSA